MANDILVKIGADVSQFGRQLGGIQKSLGDLQKTTEKNQMSFGKLAGSIGLVAVAAKGLSVLKNSMDAAISRFDTLNKFPKVLQALGVSAEESQIAMGRLSDGIDGLPTKLDEIASIAQRMYTSFNDMDKATDSALALNNALLGSGSSAADAARGTQQYIKFLQTGKMEMDSWNTLQETMDIGLIKIAEAFGYAGKTAKQDLYDALKEGVITADEFNDKLIEVGTGTGIMADLARENSLGIATSLGNLRNAAARGLADIIASFNRLSKRVTGKDIAQNIDSLKVFVNNAFKAIGRAIESSAPYVEMFASALKTVLPIVKQLTPVLIGMASAFAIHTVINKTVTVLKESKLVIEAVRIAKDLYTLAIHRNTAAAATSVTVTKLSTAAIALQNKVLAASTFAWQVMTRQITLWTAAKRIATAAAGGFRAAMTFLSGPVGWVTAGIGALAGAAVAVVKWFRRESEEAKRLNKETEKLAESTKELNDEIANTAGLYEENRKEIKNNAQANRELARRIEELSRKENMSASDKQMLIGYIEQLNESVGDLGLAYNEQTKSLNMSSKELQARLDLMHEEENMISAQKRLLEIDKERNEVQMQLKEINDLQDEWNRKKEEGAVKTREANKALEDLEEQEKSLKDTLADLTEQQKITEKQVETSSKNMAKAVEDANLKQIKSYDELENEQKKAFNRMKDHYESLIDAATNAFDKLSTETELTMDEMIKNLEHNQKVVENWGKNQAKLMEWAAEEGYYNFIYWIEQLGLDHAGELDLMVKYLESSNSKHKEELKKLAQTYEEGFGTAADVMEKKVGEGFDNVFDLMINFVQGSRQTMRSELKGAGFYEIGEEIPKQIEKGVDNKSVDVIGTIKKLARDIADPLKNTKSEFNKIGKDAAKGLETGLRSGRSSVISIAKNIAGNVANTIKGALRIQSPSRVLMELGKWTTLGLAVGMEKYAKYVTKASDYLAQEATPAISGVDLSYNTPSGLRSTLTSAVTGTVDVNSRDSALVSAIDRLSQRLTNLEVVMEGRIVGRIIEPHVSEEQERKRRINNAFRTT